MNEKSDSVQHTENRHAKLKAESARLAKAEALAEANRAEQQAAQDRKADKAEVAHLERQVGLLSEGETRDELLERIRRLRDDVPVGPLAPPPPSEVMRKQIDIEQECGRQAVAKAEAEAEQARATREAVEADVRKREGVMVEVHHPNPGQEEQFPASKATLGKTK